jgi:hypothetical protein
MIPVKAIADTIEELIEIAEREGWAYAKGHLERNAKMDDPTRHRMEGLGFSAILRWAEKADKVVRSPILAHTSCSWQ